ncbi:MAG: HlyD family secretion protein [Caulobacteraceae bacterium]
MSKKNKLTLILLVAVVGLIFTACTFVRSMTNKDSKNLVFYGTAEADQVDISAETSGRVKEIKAEEGQKVLPNSVVAVIDSPENNIKAEQSKISVKNAENELQKVEEGSRKEEINMQKALVNQGEYALKQSTAAVKQLEAAVKQAEQVVNTAREAYQQSKENYDRIKVLYNSGAATQQEMDNAEHAANTAMYALNSANHSLDSVKSQLEGAAAQSGNAQAHLTAAKEKLRLLTNGATQSTRNTAQYGVEQAEKGLELSNVLAGKSNVTTLTGGIVETVYYSKGEFVGAGSPIMTLTDPDSLWVKIYIPERALSSVKLGKQVSITCDFLKGKTIKGQIVYISPEAEFTPVNIVTKEDRMKLVFGVKVKILDNLESIKPGMLLDVNIE